jgi:hypothetical protein
MRRPLLGLPVFETIAVLVLASIAMLPAIAWIRSLFHQ